MAISISLRTSQFGDAQLDSTHFNTSAYASFIVSSANSNGDAAVANIADLSALAATLSSDIDSIMQSLSGVLGAGIAYNDTSDTFSFGAINLNSSASGASSDWTSVIEALDSALASAESNISQNTTNIGLNATAIGNNTTAIGNNTTAIGTLRSEVNSALGTTVPAFAVNATTPFIGSTANPTQTANVKSYIEALANQIQSSIVGLGSVFEYKDATSVNPQGSSTPSTDPNATLAERSLWTAGVEFQDLSTLTYQESGDYYKSASTGWVSHDGTGANAIFVNQGDGIVWNTSTPTPTIDKIDNTDFNVTGTGNISVTGDISVGFNVDSSAIDASVTGLQSELDGTQSMLGMVAGSTLNPPLVGEAGNGGYQFPSITAPTAVAYFERNGVQNGFVTKYFTDRPQAQDLVTTLSAIQSEAQTGLGNLETFQKNLAAGLGFPIKPDGHYDAGGRTGTTYLKGQGSITGELAQLDEVIGALASAIGTSIGTVADPTNIASLSLEYKPRTAGATTYLESNSSIEEDLTDLDAALSSLATSAGDLRSDVETILGVNNADLDTNGTASNLTTTAQTIVPAINELDGEVATNAGNISTNAGNISINAGNISTNATNITTNATNISGNTADIGRIVASVELEADGSKTDFDSDGQGNTFNITAGGTFKTAIEELDQALQVSQVVDTARLTVAPMSHQYAEYSRLADVNDLADYASKAFGASAGNYTNQTPTGQGDLHDFEVAEQMVVLGSRPSNAPNPLHAVDASHLNNQNYWYNVKVFKNGVRLFQRNPTAVLKASSDEYKLTEVVHPASYPANYDTYERYPMVIPTKVESTYRASQLSQAKGTIDPNAGEPHPLAGMRNLDDAGNAHPLFGQQHGDAGQPKYWTIEFGAPLNQQDIIVVDYMGLKD